MAKLESINTRKWPAATSDNSFIEVCIKAESKQNAWYNNMISCDMLLMSYALNYVRCFSYAFILPNDPMTSSKVDFMSAYFDSSICKVNVTSTEPALPALFANVHKDL